MSKRSRIVVTGAGWVTPMGHDLESVWTRLLAGETDVATIDRFDASTFPTTFASQVRNYDWTGFVDDAALHGHPGKHTQFALGAARQAWDASGLGDVSTLNRHRIGIYLGAGEGVLDFTSYQRASLAAWQEDAGVVDTVQWGDAASRFLDGIGEVEQEPNMPASHISREFGLRGPVYNCLTACAASTQAIGEAASIIQRGDADVMVSGGTHTMLHVLGVTGFNRLTAMSTRNDSPTTASRPFSRSRDGFVMGEGSGIIVMETLEHAEARGANILGEIRGFGSTADAYRITDMHPEGRGPGDAISQALEHAGIDPESRLDDGRPPVQYISAHGTSTSENDSIETRAVKRVFGDLAPEIPMTSIKSMMGHLICAAGAVEFITCLMILRDHVIPPTINLQDPDPELDLDYVPNVKREAQVDTCLSNSFGFGGQNDTLVVSRF
ncbi:MAG: beta-ketoacyl-[acyl-carrier-protein] synthase family protein [Phycisphaerales bacterium]|nr:beta-ketoacyl-[acyl-carrier-protein] synthase family protein [Phycisphaerales bacterium]